MATLQPKRLLKDSLFFLLGIVTACAFFAGSFILIFTINFRDKIYPGIRVGAVDVSGLTLTEAQRALEKRYQLDRINWQFNYSGRTWSFSNTDLKIEIPLRELAQQAYQTGRQPNPLESLRDISQSYRQGRTYPLTLIWSSADRDNFFALLRPTTDIPPVEGQFKFVPGAGADQKGRVVAFTPSKLGQTLDSERLEQDIRNQTLPLLESGFASTISLPAHTKTVEPNLTSENLNSRGIVDLLGSGESYFYDSIPGRVHNISLGTEKVTGSLIAPGEIFSFSEAIGTVSAVFGFQKAYAIIQGKTVLDDGGGVCQVSTTLYRAVLNAGLPVSERVAHTYRVSFYEQGGFLPGLDATVYPPDPDFKFRNNTANWILIQATFDKPNSKLTFEFFGSNDGREVAVSKPTILATSPPPEPVYEDDPNLPLGQVKQVDTAHPGAKVFFTRLVTRNGETLIDERVESNYVPWPARFLRGTKS